MMITHESYRAVVEKIIAKGRHGPYAVARSAQIGSVTFSLDPTVWQEEEWPDAGTCVVLSRVKKKSAGWRAQSGRYVTPADESIPNPSNSKPSKKDL